MKRSTFKVLFYLKRQSEKNGKAPVMGRITINGTVSQFSCKFSVRPALWDTSGNKAKGKSIEARQINEKLDNIRTNIGKRYQRICDRDSYVTAEKVRNAWLGFGDEQRLLLQTFDEYLQELACKRVGKDRSAGTLAEYRTRRDRLAAFLQYEYGLSDIPFRELKREFAEKFIVYLSTVRGLRSSTVFQTPKKLHAMVYLALDKGCGYRSTRFRTCGPFPNPANGAFSTMRRYSRLWMYTCRTTKRPSHGTSSYSAPLRDWPMRT